MRYLNSDEVISAVTPRDAVDALREVLKGGFDPASDPHRQKVMLPHGEMHLLPSALDGAVGVKVLGIQPAGSQVDVPLVQGSYLLMGGATLTPEVVMDAAALTEVRTPAVAVAGVLDRLRASDEPLECVIVGAGVQGRAHARTVVDVLAGVREVSVTFISRSEPADLSYSWVQSGSVAADEVLGRAGLVVVATSAGEPVVVDRQLRPDATVLAVGAHTVDTRELHDDVLRGAQVIVEDVEAARREAGDVVIAVEKGALAWEDVVTMAEVVRGEVALDPARRVVFKTVGMPWEDLAVARVVGAIVADSALNERGGSCFVDGEITSREPWLRRNIEGVFSAVTLGLSLVAAYLLYPVPGQLETVVSPSDTVSVQVAEPEKWEHVDLSWDWESRVPYLPVSEAPLEPGPTLLVEGYLKDPFGNGELTMGFWGEIGNQVSQCYLQTWEDDFEDLVPQELEAERGNSSRSADLTFIASMESVDYSGEDGTPPGVVVLCRFEPNSVWAVDPPYRDFVIPKMQIESPHGLPASNFCVESATPSGTWSRAHTNSTTSDCSEGAQRVALEGQSAQLEDAGERRTRDFKVLASGVFAGLAAESAISLLRMLFIPGSRNGWRRREYD